VKFLGTCRKCGARMYRNSNGSIVSSPASDCLCELSLRDLPLEDEYKITLTKEDLISLDEGDYVEVERVIENILDQVRQRIDAQ